MIIYGYIILCGYILGSIPFALILTKLAGHGDLRRVGSGNIGATNAMRAGGLKLALLVSLLDAAKGFFAVYFFGIWAGIAAVVGHCFPVWLKFKGGKGVATSAGVLIGISPVMFAACFGAFLIVILTTGYSSLAAFVAMPVALIFGFCISPATGLVILALSLLILWREKENIKRLLSGTESKINWKKKATAPRKKNDR
jgi:glycerol-3-phosphate acyltransferase PlsY